MGQNPSGKLLGEVRDSQNRVLPGVTCLLSRASQPGRHLTRVTESSGRFAFLGLEAGDYVLICSKQQFEGAQSPHLPVTSGGALRLDVVLAPAGVKRSRLQIIAEDNDWGSEFVNHALEQLPNARNIWSLLESQEPTTVTNRLDVGGLETGVAALFGALGASWTENSYSLNGFDVTDPYVPGRPLVEPSVDDLEEFLAIAGAKPAWVGGSGETLELDTQLARSTLHGDAKLFFAARGMQSDNMDARLRRFGFPGPERIDHLVDGQADMGGKLPFASASWPAFVSFSTQQLEKRLGGFSDPINVNVYRALAEFTPIARDTRHLNLFYSGQHVFNSREGATPQTAPSATTLANNNYHQLHGRWEEALGPNAYVSVGVGAVHAIMSSGIQPGVSGVSMLDLPLMEQSGPAPLGIAGIRTRVQSDALLQVAPPSLLGTHDLTFGVKWDRSSLSNRWNALGGLQQETVTGVGAEVNRWNTPARAHQHVQNFVLFVQDVWKPWDKIHIPLGLRFENSSGKAIGASNRIRWTTLEPRAGLVVRLKGRWPVVRASWSRYGHILQGRYLDFGNLSALGEQTFRWQDANGDRLAQPLEITQLLRVWGGPYSGVDPGLARPFTDEITAGLEQDLGDHFSVSARFFRRDDHRLIALVNSGVPFTDYAPVAVPDPGNDGLPGTADDALLTLYNENPSSLGRDFYRLANPRGDRASSKGFEIRLVRPLDRRWEFTASFTGIQTLAPTSPGNSVLENDTGFVGSLYADPNTLLFDTSRTYFDRAFIGKTTGYFFAPYGFRLAAVGKYLDGQPFGRILFVNGFNQGPFFVRATPRGHPGGFQTQFSSTLDLRVARDFELRRGKISGYLDCFNCLNMNRNTLEEDLTGPSFQSRVPLAIEAPRVTRLGVEWSF